MLSEKLQQVNCQSVRYVSFLKWLFQQSKLDSDHATDTIRSPPGLTVNPQLPENVTPTSVKRNKRPGLLQAMKKIWSKKRFQVRPCMPYFSCLACSLISDWEFEFDPYVCVFLSEGGLTQFPPLGLLALIRTPAPHPFLVNKRHPSG